jgi:hypothetical protein
VGLSERKVAQHFAAQVLPDLQGKGFVRQRSLSAESLFGYFCGDKSNSLPAAIERA